MLDSTTTLPNMVRSTISEYLENNLQTCIPAKVVKVSDFNNKQMVDVKITIATPYDDGNYLSGALLEEVPLMFPAGGGGILSFPIAIGDTVLVLFSKRSIDEWLESDGLVEVAPYRRSNFSLADAVAIAGIFTTSGALNPDPDNVVLKFAGSTTTHFANGDVHTSAANSATVSAVNDVNLLSASGDINLTANNVNINSSGLFHNGTNIGDDHTHPIVSGSSAGNTDGPQ